MANIAEILLEELNQTKTALVRSYDEKGLRASGKFEEDLEVYLEEDGAVIKGGILGAHHTIYMEFGRKPNRRQDKGMIYFIYTKILQWQKDKGITLSSPWMVARKIVMEGIKVPNPYNPGGVVADVVNDQLIEEIEQKIIDARADSFVESVKTMFKEQLTV